MSIQSFVIALLAVGTVLGMWRGYRRVGSWRSASLLLQPLFALSLYLLLYPPAPRIDASRLAVVTAGATKAQLRHLPWLTPTVTLPESGDMTQKVPDLATALRQHPQTRKLDVVGDGLPPRDQEAARGLALYFEAAPEHGLVELAAPQQVPLGTQWSLSGRLATPGLHVELHDPSGALVDSAIPDASGHFQLYGLARAAGPSRFELRLLDAQQKRIDTASVPIVAIEGEPLSIIVRVGAPDAEFKYWRRWASDAGFKLRLRAGLSEHMDLRDGDTALTPEALAQTDLVIIDERAWTTLEPSEKAALNAAVQQGLGLLLRIGGPVDAVVAGDWSAYGIAIRNLERPVGITLDRRSGLRDLAGFTAAPAEPDWPGALPLLQADDGSALALWHAAGQGRVASWRLLDSYQLSLLGETARYGALWSQTLAVLARPHPRPAAPLPPETGWLDERSVLCGLGASSAVIAPDDSRAELEASAGCAAFWPAMPGWHTLQTQGSAVPFYVRDADDGASLRDARNRRETLQMVSGVGDAPAAADEQQASITPPRWPFALLWLIAATLLWWQERKALI